MLLRPGVRDEEPEPSTGLRGSGRDAADRRVLRGPDRAAVVPARHGGRGGGGERRAAGRGGDALHGDDAVPDDDREIGVIAIDAIYTPVKRVNYEVENMRVGDKTNHNRLRMSIETDGTLTPNEALEQSITLMIHQLKAIVGFKEPEAVYFPDLNSIGFQYHTH